MIILYLIDYTLIFLLWIGDDILSYTVGMTTIKLYDTDEVSLAIVVMEKNDHIYKLIFYNIFVTFLSMTYMT